MIYTLKHPKTSKIAHFFKKCSFRAEWASVPPGLDDFGPQNWIPQVQIGLKSCKDQ